MKRNIVLTAVALLVVAASAWFAWRLAHPSLAARNHAELQRTADDLNLRLPRAYVDELVMDHAHVDGNRLVVDIRIPDIRMKDLNPKKIPLIHRQEQMDLNTDACATPAFASLLQHQAQVARRFLDRDGKLIFEIAANLPDCKPQQATP